MFQIMYKDYLTASVFPSEKMANDRRTDLIMRFVRRNKVAVATAASLFKVLPY